MARKTARENEAEQSQDVEVAQPVVEPQTNQPAEDTQESQESRTSVQGDTRVRVTGRAGRYIVDEVEYRRGQVYEVDAATAEKLLNYTGPDGNQAFVQADN